MPKIYAISLNPAIDYVLKFKELKLDKTNRPYQTDMYAAGKGIHISLLLNELEFENESIVFLNGHFADFFIQDLKANHVKYQKFSTNGEIRINLKLIDQFQTECSVPGPEISASEFEKLLAYLKEVIQPGDYVVASGSLPSNCPTDVYQKIGIAVKQNEGHFVVDAYGESLLQALQTKPFLIKPNLDELEQTFKVKITTEKQLFEYAQKLIDLGAQNVLLSRGEKGGVLINQHSIVTCGIYQWGKKLENAAGAGDSMLAGFIVKYINTSDFNEALKFSVVCGSATAYSSRIASRELIDELNQKNHLMETKKLV
ncbi:1-phosphofructokinase [Spiroplasma clarkii]|uniref:1-phosphofructokinase n=1 Tax=Spiroplasma clarkii TaxID=2139 RepID=A0A1Y0KZS1_9MOLU|nr:1-phosphofructokinase family hexose kinase [Spiroplasma clarkii]ARU90968.1 1-phosphofructokinase [Spiroplasma clarkii]ATX70409.1 1-phosphofructokinase [Spiroplasma clarkii]